MKKGLLATTAAFAMLAIAGCSQTADSEDTAEAGDHTASEWGYGADNGPEKWGDLSADYASCKNGKEQSPVDLPAADKAKLVTVSTNYGDATGSIVDNGHTIQASFPNGTTLTSGDKEYGLVQVHFHTPSENTIAGKAYPLTAHFVHADADSKLAVLGVMFEEGDANPQLQAILDNVSGSAKLNLAALLPGELKAYNFPGSLTTPPCSEGVNWHVLSTPISASAEQIAAFNKAMGNNARPVQPANERTF